MLFWAMHESEGACEDFRGELAQIANRIDDEKQSPVFCNLKGPLERQVGLLVIIDKAGDGIIAITGQWARRRILFLD